MATRSISCGTTAARIVLARGAMNSCLCMFEDGYTMVTSRNALELVAGDAFRLDRAAEDRGGRMSRPRRNEHWIPPLAPCAAR
jgi:hypothetical protein